MKTTKLSLLALAAAIFAAGCAKTETPTTIDESSPQVVMKTYTCTIAPVIDPETKVEISDAGKTTWKERDEIMFHGRNTGYSSTYGYYSYVVTLQSSDISSDGKTATFTMPEIYSQSSSGHYVHGRSDIFALYPASAAVDADNGVTNWYSYNKFKNTNDFLMSGYNDLDNSDGSAFTFHNACGIISFTVNDADIKSYLFTGNDGETVAYDNYQTDVYLASSGSVSANWLYAGTALTSVSKDVVADGTTKNFICLPTGTNFTSGFTIKFLNESGDIIKFVKGSNPVNVARNAYLPLGDITSKLKVYTAPTTSDHTAAAEIKAGAIDLSAAGKANCYVVSAAGNYKFPAMKGNTDTEAGNVFDVELLWETYNNAETVIANSVISAVDFEDNWIYFSTPSTLKPGNALIAAKNVLGTILWSWHIWIPETAFASDTYSISGRAMMSRNLGALVDATASSDADVDVKSFGLLYQWGRKDPFPGVRAVATNSAARVSGTSMTKYTTDNSAQMTRLYAQQNPTVFGNYKGDWTAEHDNDAWGDVSGNKAIDDPCPPGYKVPRRDDSGNVLFKTADLTGVTGWENNSTYHWFTVGDPKAVFPITGYLYYNGNFDHAADRAIIWNSHKGSDDAAYTHTYDAGATNLTQYQKAYGASVRCVAE